jgi:hypothetical protein
VADNEKPDFARAVREAYERTPAGDDLARQRLLARLDEAPPPRRVPAWRPAFAGAERTLWIAAGVLAVATGVLVAGIIDPVREPPAPRVPEAGAGHEVVRFALDVPGAERVALVGDFNDWDPAATPMRRGPSRDIWSVSLPVSRGRHVYGFVVDQQRWLPDPGAPQAPEDGFGSASSVIVVNGSEP